MSNNFDWLLSVLRSRTTKPDADLDDVTMATLEGNLNDLKGSIFFLRLQRALHVREIEGVDISELIQYQEGLLVALEDQIERRSRAS